MWVLPLIKPLFCVFLSVTVDRFHVLTIDLLIEFYWMYYNYNFHVAHIFAQVV